MTDSDEEDIEKALKIVLVGDSCCGKTALCVKLSEHSFQQKYIQTSGVDFYSKRIALPSSTDVLLQLWDVGGHNIGSNMLNTYVFGAHAVLFVYDVTNAQSFENICDWIAIVKKMSRQMEKSFYMAIVGSKTDMEHRRVVSIERNNKAAEQYGLSPFYVSAKTGDNVDLMFKTISSEILGIRLTKAEQEWNISVVQAQTSGDNNNTSRTVYPYYKNLHMGVINNQHENNTTPAAQLPALPSQPKNSQEIAFENRNMGASTAEQPNPPTIPHPQIKFGLKNRNSIVCNIS